MVWGESCSQSFDEESNVGEPTHDRFFKSLWLVGAWVVQELLKYGIDNSLADLRACSAEFLPHLLRVGDIDDVVENVVADIFFDDSRCCSYGHPIFFDLLLLDSCWGRPWARFYEIPYILFDEHGPRQV